MDEQMRETLLNYAYSRIVELEKLLLPDIENTVLPAEVVIVFSQIENAGKLPAHHQRRLQHHINRMWLEKCRYRQLSPRQVRLPALWRNTRERNHR